MSPIRIVVMGVSGSGKTTVGRLLAGRLGYAFIDADDLHPRSNIEKMTAGRPLSDIDRAPWLQAAGLALRDTGKNCVLACSALRRSYRDQITKVVGGPVLFVHLDGCQQVLRRRLQDRKDHFMGPDLLDSQLAALEIPEPDEHAITVGIDADQDVIVETIMRQVERCGADVGLAGLGVMGANLALNMAERGFRVAVYDRDNRTVDRLIADAGALAEWMIPCRTEAALIEALQPPRAIIMLVPAGSAVDDLITTLKPQLQKYDLLADAGNSHFNDTVRRGQELAAAGIGWLGIGLSGGADGARHGPAIMAGGDHSAWLRLSPVFEALAARHEQQPCAAWVGPDGAGHFVKTIHNGIEYADMQMITEATDLLRGFLGYTASQAAQVFANWNKGPLESYLIEITAKILNTDDMQTHAPVVDIIRDSAGQKGTGRWAAIASFDVGAPASTMEAALTARALSTKRSARQFALKIYGSPQLPASQTTGAHLIDDLEQALLAGRLVALAQGFSVLAAASRCHDWDLPLSKIAGNWRAGCIIRSRLLKSISETLQHEPDCENLLLAPPIAELMTGAKSGLRRVVTISVETGLPAPALSAALSWFDLLRQTRSGAALIQAQRDFFGNHGFERTDRDGQFHGPWFGNLP